MDIKNIRDAIYQENDALPFITSLELENGTTYIGVVLNSDKHSISFIDLERITLDEDLCDFLEICLDWWWYSNRKIPVNLFKPNSTFKYMQYVKHIPQKNTNIIRGYTVSMQDIITNSKSYRRNRSLNIIN